MSAAWPPVGRRGRALGLGVMRLPIAEDRARAEATLAAALEAGVTVLDTARAYGEPQERGLAELLGALGAAGAVSVVTKCGMRREGARWRPDGRARSVAEDAAASARALGDIPIGMLLIHAPDPAVPWATTVRALGRAAAAGVAARVGVSNVTRAQLAEALELAPIAAVEVALSPSDRGALDGGVVGLAIERGLAVLVHSPFGGPRRAARLERALGADAHGRVLAALLALHPSVIPLPGATRPETARAIGEAAARPPDLALAAQLRWSLAPPALAPVGDGEVLLVMGLPGSGKSTRARALEGYARLNRDERGGTLAALHAELDRRLAAGERRLVLDNLYLTRAARRAVLDVCARHAVAARALWLDTPLAEAERNVAARIIAGAGRLLEPEALAHSKVPGVFPPTTLLGLARTLEPPSADEGFASIEVRPFSRAPAPPTAVPARAVALEALLDEAGAVRADAARRHLGARDRPTLVFGWRAALAPEVRAALELAAGAPVDVALCPHGGGPPRCWCRPPLLGLLLAWAGDRVDWAASEVVGASAAHARMAGALGAAYVEAASPRRRD